jgi:hypothetical protein
MNIEVAPLTHAPQASIFLVLTEYGIKNLRFFIPHWKKYALLIILSLVMLLRRGRSFISVCGAKLAYFLAREK